MGMSVNDGVDIISVGRYSSAGPVRDGTVCTQVAYQEHVFRAFFAHVVNGPLHSFINFFAGLVFTETVDEFSVLILEIFWCGSHQGFRSSYTHKANLFSAQNNNLGRFQNRFTGLYIHKVTGVITAFHPGSQLQETLHTVIKFMVAGDDKVIAHCIHNLDNGLAGGKFPDGCALDGIAGICQRHGMPLLFQIFFILGHLVNAQVIRDAAVDIVSMQYDNFLAGCQYRYRKQQRYQHCQCHAVEFLQVSGHFICPF